MKKRDSKSQANSNESFNFSTGDPGHYTEVNPSNSFEDQQQPREENYQLKPAPEIKIHYSLGAPKPLPEEDSSTLTFSQHLSRTSSLPKDVNMSQELISQSNAGLYKNLELNNNDFDQVDLASRTPTSKLEVIDLEPSKQPKKKEAWYKRFTPNSLNPMKIMKKSKKKKSRRSSKDAKNTPEDQVYVFDIDNNNADTKPNEAKQSEKKENGLFNNMKKVSNKSIKGVKKVSNKSIGGVKKVSNKSMEGVKNVSHKSIEGAKNVSKNTMNMIKGKRGSRKASRSESHPVTPEHTNTESDPETITPSIKETAKQAKMEKKKKIAKQTGQGLMAVGVLGGASLLLGPVVIPVAAVGGIAAYGISKYNASDDPEEKEEQKKSKENGNEACYIDEIMASKQKKKKKTVKINSSKKPAIMPKSIEDLV